MTILKSIVYHTQKKGKIPILSDFELALRPYERIEYYIGIKKSQLASHGVKYENILYHFQS